MTNTNQQTKCGECDALLNELPSIPAKERRPCPTCGSLSRKFEITIQDTVIVREKLGVKARHKPAGKPFREITSGDDLHRKTGKWMHLERTVDRDNDLYKEVVKDPKTGEIVHMCEEPLTKHRGHGSAKKRRESK